MNKKIRALALLVAVLAIGMTFLGCGNDTNRLVGTWVLTNTNNPPSGWVTATEIELFRDGTGRMNFGERSGFGILALTWTAEGGRLRYEIMGQFIILDYEIRGSSLTLYNDRATNSFSVYERRR